MIRKHCPACHAPMPSWRYTVPVAPFLRAMGAAHASNTKTSVEQCYDCGTVFSRWAPDEQEADALYRGYRGREYTALRLQHEPMYDPEGIAALAACDERKERIAELRAPNGIALDYGGDGALFPEEWHSYSYDPFGNDAAYGVIPVERLSDFTGRCDMVTCLHVLEHVAEPVEVVREAFALLQPGGMMYVEVPMAGDVLAGLMPTRVHEHVQWFSVLGLHRMLDCFGDIKHAETYRGPLGLCRWVEVQRV